MKKSTHNILANAHILFSLANGTLNIQFCWTLFRSLLLLHRMVYLISTFKKMAITTYFPSIIRKLHVLMSKCRIYRFSYIELSLSLPPFRTIYQRRNFLFVQSRHKRMKRVQMYALRSNVFLFVLRLCTRCTHTHTQTHTNATRECYKLISRLSLYSVHTIFLFVIHAVLPGCVLWIVVLRLATVRHEQQIHTEINKANKK